MYIYVMCEQFNTLAVMIEILHKQAWDFKQH